MSNLAPRKRGAHRRHGTFTREIEFDEAADGLSVGLPPNSITSPSGGSGRSMKNLFGFGRQRSQTVKSSKSSKSSKKGRTVRIQGPSGAGHSPGGSGSRSQSRSASSERREQNGGPHKEKLLKPSVAASQGPRAWNADKNRLHTKSDVVVLKRLKEHVHFAVDHALVGKSKLRNQVMQALESVWTLEYDVLKERLRKSAIVSKSHKERRKTRMEIQHFTRVRQKDDEDIAEAAKWLMGSFFEKAEEVREESATESTMFDVNRFLVKQENKEEDEKSKETPIQRFRRCAKRVMVTTVIMNTTNNPVLNAMSENPQLKEALHSIGTWEYSPFDFEALEAAQGNTLVISAYHVLSRLGILDQLEVSHRKMWNFLADVQDAYLDIPYHNALHAADVMSTLYCVLRCEYFQAHLCPMDMFAAILASAVHDLGHDGYNNAWHVNVQSDRALTYNDASVLENYHVSRAFFLLKKAQNNWGKKLPRATRKYLRNTLVSMVLATDMHFHFREVTRLQQFVGALRQEAQQGLSRMNTPRLTDDDSARSKALSVSAADDRRDDSKGDIEESANSLPAAGPHLATFESYENTLPTPGLSFSEMPLQTTKRATLAIDHGGAFDRLYARDVDNQVVEGDTRVSGVDDERLFLLGSAIHLCDISNPTKKLKVCNEWADRIMTEFFKQGDDERALGLAVSPMMDRNKASKPSGQIGFIKFIVQPIFEVFAEFVPELKEHMATMEENLDHWEFVRHQTKTTRKPPG